MTAKRLLPKAGRKTSRIRPHETTAADAKALVLGAANVLAGVFGFFDSLEKGVLVGDAARKEVKRAAGRARALAKAQRDAEVAEASESAEDT